MNLSAIDRLLRDLRHAAERLPEPARPEPARAMLLDLAANGTRGRPVSVTSACIASCAPHTTALRYLGELERAQLVERHPDPRDRRRSWIALTGAGEAAVAGYLASVGA